MMIREAMEAVVMVEATATAEAREVTEVDREDTVAEDTKQFSSLMYKHLKVFLCQFPCFNYCCICCYIVIC